MWFESLFSYPLDAFQSGRFLFTNVVEPTWWFVGCTIAVCVIVLSVVFGRHTRNLAWWQRGVLASFQVALALGVIGLLAGPALETSTLQPGANTVAVLIDTSASMGFPNAVDGTGQTRLEAAVQLAQQVLNPTLSDFADVELYTFDASAVRLDAADGLTGRRALGSETNLIGSATTVLESFTGAPLAAVIVLSDGADNGGRRGGKSAALAAPGVPVHTIGFGPRTLPGEVQLADVQMAADAPPASQVTAHLVIEQTGGGDTVVRVRDGGKLVAVQRLQLPEDTPTVRTDITFDSGDVGIRELTFEIEPPPGDVLARNNQIRRLLTVNERHRRFLYLEGEPRWEYKFIRRAVSGDEVLQLVSWLRTTDRKTYRQGVADEDELVDGFPADLASLYGYDVIVLGSLAATSFSQQQHEWLESFVAERGGSLLVLAGRQSLSDGGWDAQPLAAALPVVLGRGSGPTYGAAEGRARPTRDGLTSPLTQMIEGEGVETWATLPMLGDYQQLGALKPAATTLLELVQADSVSPLLVTQPYGLGTTAILASATTWRWQMRTPPDDPRHRLFWRQLLRQLAETAQRLKHVDLDVEEGSIHVRASVRNRMFEPAAGVTAHALVTHPDATQTRLDLVASDVAGVLATSFDADLAGVYRVDVAIEDPAGAETITRFVQTGAANREYLRPVQDEALLRRIADATGGRYWRPEAIDGIAAELTFGGSGVRVVEILPLWTMPACFLLLVLLKLGDWGLRRVWGRV